MISVDLILQLQNIKGVGPATINKFISFITENSFKTFDDDILLDIFNHLNRIDKKVKVPTKDNLLDAKKLADEILESSENNQIKIISFYSNDYPMLLRNLSDAPLLLHVKGDIDIFDTPTIAVIGTREPSLYGQRLGKRFSDILVDNDLTIVSGLALGCDTIGHQSSVDKRKPTIAVMAGGLHSIYPKENKVLSEQILETGGLLVSELPFGENPNKNTFVQRDRLQSGLSYATAIIQTGLKSGTLHTAKFTIEQNRILSCLYTDNLVEQVHEKYQGNKMLIEQGAWKLDNREIIEHLIFTVKNSNYGVDAIIFDFDQTIADTSKIKHLRDSRSWNLVKDNLDKIILYDGMLQLFDELNRLKIKIGIVTNSPSSYCKTIMDFFNLKYDTIVGYHDTQNKKPHQEPILLALKNMNVFNFNRVLGLGDNFIDINTYQNAGIRPIACMWGWSDRLDVDFYKCYKILIPLDLLCLIR